MSSSDKPSPPISSQPAQSPQNGPAAARGDGPQPAGDGSHANEVVAEAVVITSTASPPSRPDRGNRQLLTVVAVLVIWTLAYNVLIKEQGLGWAFFKVLDTISDDFVTGSFLAIGLGLAIVVVFSVTKLYGQIISNIHSFALLEELLYYDLRAGHVVLFLRKLLNFRDQPVPTHVCPRHIGGMLFGLSFIYLMSWIYVVLFSEALFFLSWSSGVDLPITGKNMLLMPTLALAIPFSARVMAYLRYPYAEDYADFMPAAVFALLMVAALGFLFESGDQKFFLATIYQDRQIWADFLSNGVFLAFIPVFFEAAYWLLDVFVRTPKDRSSR